MWNNNNFFVQQTTPNPFLANGQVANGQVSNGQVVNSFNFNPSDPLQFGNLNYLNGGLQSNLNYLNTPGRTQFMSGQFSGAQRLVQQQFTMPPPTQSPAAPTAPVLFPREPQQAPSIPEPISPAFSSSSFVNLNNPANVQYIDDADPQNFGNHALFKRNENNPRRVVKIRKIVKREPEANAEKVNKKRALIPLSDGSFVDDTNLADNGAFVYDGLAQFGADDFQGNFAKPGDIEDEIREHDRESAEGEVNAVLSMCSSCQTEPFIGAVALAWKTAKIQTENALKGRSVGSCGAF